MSDVIITVDKLSKRYKLGQIGATTLRESAERWWHALRGRNPDHYMGEVGSSSPSRQERQDGEGSHAAAQRTQSGIGFEQKETKGTKGEVGQEARGKNGTTPYPLPLTSSPDYVWALKDVSFEVKRGEVLGIIGRNGAGKSTLLKILSRITEPTSGRAILRGRVGSLLEVGTGFHPELSGRENIYLNGAILGMKRREIDAKFDEIVAFSEVEKFLDTPVKRYSSGMYVRLAFAVAAHLEPEILVVDEVLAVGDAAFQKKCLGKMGDIAHQGRTVLFVSHNMGAVRKLCGRAMWINYGCIVQAGPTAGVIDSYFSNVENKNGNITLSGSGEHGGGKRVRLMGVSVLNNKGEDARIVSGGDPFFVEIKYQILEPIANFRTGYVLTSEDGTYVFTSGDDDPSGRGTQRAPGVYVSRCQMPGCLLNGGRYYISVAADIPMQEILYKRNNAASFMVDLLGTVGSESLDGRLGVVRPLLHWDVIVKT